jgi:hypothetical protein
MFLGRNTYIYPGPLLSVYENSNQINLKCIAVSYRVEVSPDTSHCPQTHRILRVAFGTAYELEPLRSHCAIHVLTGATSINPTNCIIPLPRDQFKLSLDLILMEHTTALRFHSSPHQNLTRTNEHAVFLTLSDEAISCTIKNDMLSSHM